MENASKALIMAGIILIGVLLLALMVYFFSSAYGLKSAYTENVNNARMVEFNTKFTKYNITESDYNNSKGKTYVTIYDIITVANYAAEFNEELTKEDSEYIKIEVTNIEYGKEIVENANYLLSAYNKSENIFFATEIGYDTTGRINLMRFKLKT